MDPYQITFLCLTAEFANIFFIEKADQDPNNMAESGRGSSTGPGSVSKFGATEGQQSKRQKEQNKFR